MKVSLGIGKYKESDCFPRREGGPSRVPRDIMSVFNVLGLQPAVMKEFLLTCHSGILG